MDKDEGRTIHRACFRLLADETRNQLGQSGKRHLLEVFAVCGEVRCPLGRMGGWRGIPKGRWLH